MTRRADQHQFKVELMDGRGTASVYVADGYDRPISQVFYVEGVHTRGEAIAAYREDLTVEKAERMAKRAESFIQHASTQDDREHWQREADYYWGQA